MYVDKNNIEREMVETAYTRIYYINGRVGNVVEKHFLSYLPK